MSKKKLQSREAINKARDRGQAKRNEAISKIDARTEAARAPHSITLSQFLELPATERRKIRFIGGRKIEAPQAKKSAAADKFDEIRCAIIKILSEDTGNKNLPSKTIASRLQSNYKSYFVNGTPYQSEETFLRKVRLALAEIRPRKNHAR